MKLTVRRCSVLVCFLALSGIFLSACLTPAQGPDSPRAGEQGQAESPNTESADGLGAGFEAPRAFGRSSAELMAELKIGWNLGNSLDVPDGETAWGNPPVTLEFLKKVRSAGFRLVRIPVTWTKRMGPGPNYAIEKSWMERVREVARDARTAGLYAIINVHHDGADGFEGVEWLTLNDVEGKTTDQNNALVTARFVALWEQIAASFSDFGEELLFESMNEIHDGYGPPDPRHMEFINELNQTFVRLVRASGGNNEERHLVVPGYNTNIEHTVTGFRAPEDSTKNRLILSVHFYDPYLFALQAKVHTWGADSPGRDDFGQEDHVDSQFDKIKTTFIDKGLPVLLGEYGATYQAGYEDYRRYYMEYVTRAAATRGIVPVYWDNGGKGSGAENFGLFDRNNGAVLHPKMLDAMMRAFRGGSNLTELEPPQGSK